MKIGIYDDGTVPLRGGGFTLKSEIIRGLQALPPGGRDELVTVGWQQPSAGIAGCAYRESPAQLQPYLRRGRARHARCRSMLKDAWLLLQGRTEEVRRRWVASGGYDEAARRREFEQQLLAERFDLMIYLEHVDVLTTRIPYICLCWDLAYLEVPFFPETNFSGWWVEGGRMRRELMQRAVVVVTGTETGRRQVMHHYGIPESRIAVLPFPVPSGLLAEGGETSEAVRHLLQDPDPFLFYPASFWPHKNHAGLLEAMAILRQRGTRIRLVLCGADKGNRGFVEDRIRSLDLGGRVRIVDFLPRPDVNALYRAALALVFPTFIGPDNLPPLEAFALGCPVLASSVEGAAEQMGDAALFFNPAEPATLADRVQELLAGEALRRELVGRGRVRAQGWGPAEYARALLGLADRYRPYQQCFSLRDYAPKFS